MNKAYRTMNKEGTLNIRFKKKIGFDDLYHDLLKLSWKAFFALFTAAFFLLNAVFGLLYFLISNDQFTGLRAESGIAHYLECFFFSVQTFGTIGYGGISPIGVASNAIVTLESYTSLFVAAVLTGMIFARFAKPSAKVMFSFNAVVRPFDGIPCLMFRMANARQNFVTDARVKVSFALDDKKTGFRNFYDLKLERDTTPIFALSWTIAHDITEESPLFGVTPEQWRAGNGELIVSFSGTDTTLSQNLYAKSSYIIDEILFDHDFVDVLSRTDDGEVIFDRERFNEVKPFNLMHLTRN